MRCRLGFATCVFWWGRRPHGHGEFNLWRPNHPSYSYVYCTSTGGVGVGTPLASASGGVFSSESVVVGSRDAEAEAETESFGGGGSGTRMGGTGGSTDCNGGRPSPLTFRTRRIAIE